MQQKGISYNILFFCLPYILLLYSGTKRIITQKYELDIRVDMKNSPDFRAAA